MNIGPVSNNVCFRGMSPKEIVEMNFDLALVKSAIFPRAIEKTANKMGKKYPELVDNVILRNHANAVSLKNMVREDSRQMPFIQRLFVYLIQVPHEIKKSYKNLSN